MSIAFRITLIIVSVFTLLYMCKKVKQEKLQIEYSIFWTLFAIMLVLFSIFPQIADWMSELVGVYSTTNFIFLLIIFILLVKCFHPPPSGGRPARDSTGTRHVGPSDRSAPFPPPSGGGCSG